MSSTMKLQSVSRALFSAHTAPNDACDDVRWSVREHVEGHTRALKMDLGAALLASTYRKGAVAQV